MLTLHIDLDVFIRACLNDPDLRARIVDALDGPPAPVLAPFAYVGTGATRLGATLKTNRTGTPGVHGFVPCDAVGWIACRLEEVIAAEHDASTISAEQLAARLAGDQDCE
jgi:hypothetical protein